MKEGDKVIALSDYSYGINLKKGGIYTIAQLDHSRDHVIYITNGPLLHSNVYSVFKKHFRKETNIPSYEIF